MSEHKNAAHILNPMSNEADSKLNLLLKNQPGVRSQVKVVTWP